MEETLRTTRRTFPEPAQTMHEVDEALRMRVIENRVETVTEQGTVPVVIVPQEINGASAMRLALQAAANVRN